MGSTSINDAGSLFGSLSSQTQMKLAGKISSPASAEKVSNSPKFDSVLSAGMNRVMKNSTMDYSAERSNVVNEKPASNQKTDSDRIAGETSAEARKTSATDNKQEKDTKNVSTKDEASAQVSDKKDDLSVNELEKAQEVLGTIAADLMAKIEELLGISEQEGQLLLANMGLTETDLLDSANLSAFALQAMGAEDSLSLITDENRYEQFTQIMAELDKTLASDSGLSLGDVANLKAMLDEKVPSAPVFSHAAVEGNEDVSAELAQAAGEDGNTLGAAAMLKNQKGEKEASNNDADNHAGAGMMNQEPQTQAVASGPVPEPINRYADTQDIANQILDYVKANVKADTQTLEMQLHPASLGNVQINLVNKGGNISASFVAQDEQVKAAIENQMIQLRERFEEQGIKVTAIEVSVAAHGFSQSLDSRQQGNAQQEDHRAPRRRLNIGAGFGMEEFEELSEADRLAAEMLKANGGTVDLQA